jgi:predicted unusual protein kinase regulating ubiquinone biosynthesis (AarF/ABC1/UbiB family)
MELINGVKIDDIDGIRAMGLDTVEVIAMIIGITCFMH